jgi:hypothetical protein
MATEAAGTLNDEYVGIKVRLLDHNYGLFKERDNVSYLFDNCLYRSVAELYDLKANWVNNLSFVRTNVRSLWANFDTLSQFINTLESCFDIIAITEYWLDPSSDSLFMLNDYNLISVPRSYGRGGGVCIYVLKNIASSVLPARAAPQFSTFEHAEIKIKKGLKDVCIVSVVYRPPNVSVPDFITEFNSFIDYIGQKSKYGKINAVIMGDYNINLLHTHTVEDVACFLDLLYSHGFFPAILKPTRITAHSSTLIDNIFITSPAFLQSGLITCDISDHMHIYVVLPGQPGNLLNNAQTNTSPVKRYLRTFTPEALHNIKQALLTAHWKFLSDYSSVHDDYDKLVHVIITTCNKFAPIKALVSKSKPRNNTP